MIFVHLHAFSQSSTIIPNQGISVPQFPTSFISSMTTQSKGTVVFDNELNSIKYWDGTVWQNMSSSNSWQNNGTDQYNTNIGNVGIGTQTPSYKLTIDGGLGLSESNIFYGSLSKNAANGALIINAKTSPSVLFSPDNLALQVSTFGPFANFTAGYVGVGTATPLTKLDVVGELMTRKRLILSNQSGSDPSSTPIWAMDNYNNDFRIFQQPNLSNSGNTHFIVKNNTGEVGIGTFNTLGYKLAVNGTIRANEVIVETGWADYVFEENYKLRSIDEMEAFVKANKHLPNIPKASEIENNGLKVGETNKVMMEKIEELALYIIQLKKEIDVIKAKN